MLAVLKTLAEMRGLPAILRAEYEAGPPALEQRTECTVIFSTRLEELEKDADATLILSSGVKH